jgi:hypothetical protein
MWVESPRVLHIYGGGGGINNEVVGIFEGKEWQQIN